MDDQGGAAGGSEVVFAEEMPFIQVRADELGLICETPALGAPLWTSMGDSVGLETLGPESCYNCAEPKQGRGEI